MSSTIGYIISCIIAVLYLSIIGIVWAVILYPISIIARSLGWASYAKSSGKIYFYITALAVFIGGFWLLSGVVPLFGYSKQINVPTIKQMAVIWIGYSIVEAFSYALMIKESKFFVGGLASFGGIWFIWTMLNATISELQAFMPYFVHAVPFLLISSAFAIAGFLTVSPTEETVSHYPSPRVQPVMPTQQTIICPYCGKQIPAESIYCPYCGKKVT